MKLSKTLYALAAIIVTVSAGGCSSEEPLQLSEESLSITVADGGYAGESRATDTGYITEFTDGDKIGVYAVKNGEIVARNLCFTATVGADGALTWQGNSRQLSSAGTDATTYYAYYPYTKTPGADVMPAAADARGFFESIVNAWQPDDDQSTPEAYTGSDLMVAKGTLRNNQVSFVMSHAMGLVKITFPEGRYRFTNVPAIPDYVLADAGEVTFGTHSPRQLSTLSYVMLVNPANAPASISGTCGSGENTRRWKFTPGVAAGQVSTYNIDGDKNIGVISHKLQVGDFFLADGRLLSKDAPADEVAAANVVGIVYNINTTRIGDAEKEALGGIVHGSVFATRYALNNGSPTNFVWANAKVDETIYGIPDVVGANSVETYRNADKLISGLEVVQNVIKNNGTFYEKGYYEALKHARDYGMDTPQYETLKSVTTGWYLPAPGQMHDLARNLCGINISDANVTSYNWADTYLWQNIGTPSITFDAALEKVADANKDLFGGQSRFMWTAAQATVDYGCTIAIGNGTQINSVNCTPQPKTSWQYAVRPVLTF